MTLSRPVRVIRRTKSTAAWLMPVWAVVALCVAEATGADSRIVLRQEAYQIRAGETTPLLLDAGSAKFAARAKEIRTSPTGSTSRTHPTVGRDHETGALFLANPLSLAPGRYRVDFAIADEQGESRTGTVQVEVRPIRPVEQNGRIPVVLLKGFSASIAGCPPANGPQETFGNLAQYILNDGVPAWYFFDNCRECPGCSTAELGNQLRAVLDSLYYTESGAPIPEVDVVAHSMGGLIVRSYLSGKQNLAATFDPPSRVRIRKAAFVGTPHFGSGLADATLGIGSQVPDMRLGSRFLWDLALWNQGVDDLRQVDAIAIVGSDGPSGGAANLGDGVVSLTSAALTFARSPERTRIVPYCHAPALPLVCNGAAGLAKVDSQGHLTWQILRAFLRGSSEWRHIGTSPAEHPVLRNWGGLAFAVLDSHGNVVQDVQRADYVYADGSTLALSRQAGGVYYREWVPSGPGRIGFAVGGQAYTIDTYLDVGLFNTRFAKFGPIISRAIPAAGFVPIYSLAPGSLVSIYGFGLTQGQQESAGSPWPSELAGAVVGANGKRVPVFYAGPNQVNAYLPEGLSGLVKLGVWNDSGSHVVNVLIEDAVPALFSRNGTGTGPAAAINAVTGQMVTAEQPLHAGDVASMFATGMGRTSFGGGLSWTNSWPTVLIGGSQAEVLFTGLAPGFVGLYQVNARVPTDAQRGRATLVQVQTNGRISNEVTLNVQ